MRIFIRILILFALAVGIAIGGRFNAGNVVLFYPPTRIDVSLNFFLLILAAVFFVVYVIVRTIVVTTEMPKKVTEYRQSKRERESNRALRDALKALFEGRFGHAEKSAAKALDLPENKALASLIGAKAAHHMSQSERRNAWFAGIEDDTAYKTARLVTMTELYVDEHKAEQALEAVKELNARGKRHIQVLRWALKANQQAKNWTEVVKLVRTLEKNHAIHPALAGRLREMSYEALLKENGHDAESLRRIWSEVPVTERKNRYIAVIAAAAFTQCQLLEEHCEDWLKKQVKNAELELTLGVLCFHQKLWGKAQVHMEDALSHAQEARIVREANLSLAQLHEKLGQPAEATKHYRQCALATSL